MTTQTAGDMDIFAFSAPKASAVQPEADPRSTQDSVPNRNRNSFVEKVKPWHFIAVLAVVAAIWIFVPKILRSNASTSQGQQFSTQATQPTYVPNERPIPARAVEEPLSPPQPVADQVEMIQVKANWRLSRRSLLSCRVRSENFRRKSRCWSHGLLIHRRKPRRGCKLYVISQPFQPVPRPRYSLDTASTPYTRIKPGWDTISEHSLSRSAMCLMEFVCSV